DFCLLDDGTLALFYSSEKHVTDNPSYSQIISEKISTDDGRTWGSEIWVVWDPNAPAERPGMPVVTKMANGHYLVVFEVVGSHQANVFCKTSNDGKTWKDGLGQTVPGQAGGPYVVSLNHGRLAVTSNTGNVSFSDDFGVSWRLNDPPAWGNGTIKTYWWLSVYQTGPGEIGVVASVPRASGGTDVRIKFGTFSPMTSKN
ncbi:MAG: sialidase family protein, partial [Verrucomicrobiota bacterium]